MMGFQQGTHIAEDNKRGGTCVGRAGHSPEDIVPMSVAGLGAERDLDVANVR